MAKNEKLVEILEKKYGIRTLAQLNEALAEQKTIDLSPFVTPGGLGIKSKSKEIAVCV